MVLSTSELQPKTNIAGLQSLFVPSSPLTLTSYGAEQDPLDSFVRTPAVGNPRNPKQLIMAVPVSQSPEDSNPPAPFLQVFDVFTSQHVSRQALTRNMVTSNNTGPEHNKLREPNVTLLQVSCDGQWLATVEEWTPPIVDIVHTAHAKDDLSREAERRRETYIKFWRWINNEEGYWALETRIDLPHQSNSDPCANRIFDLISNPAEIGFATLGEDGFVRVWKPKTRLGDGRVVRGAKTNGAVITWTCAFAVELENSAIPLEDVTAFTNGKIAYSNDGSMLAATIQHTDDTAANVVHFLDASNGSIRFSESTMYSSNLLGMGFVNRYFITLSNELRIWDMVANKLVYGFKLNVPKLAPKHREAMSHLAINMTSNTFAIAVPNKPESTFPGLDSVDMIRMIGISTTVLIFDPKELAPVFAVEIPGVVTTLVGMQGAPGFVVLDAAAEVRVLAPKVAATVGAVLKSEIASDDMQLDVDDDEEEDEDEEVALAVENVAHEASAEAGEDKVDDSDLEDGDKPIVRPEHLEKLFEGMQSFAMPNVKDLFYDVVGLYARRKDEGSAI